MPKMLHRITAVQVCDARNGAMKIHRPAPEKTSGQVIKILT